MTRYNEIADKTEHVGELLREIDDLDESDEFTPEIYIAIGKVARVQGKAEELAGTR